MLIPNIAAMVSKEMGAAQQAQNTANAAAKSYSQIDLSSLSIEQLWQRGQKKQCRCRSVGME